MRISFHGAAREVTGSCHLLEVNGRRILLDCGLIQGGKERHERNRESFPFEPSELDCVVLSHAHIDHSGRLPLLVKRGYEGPIVATEATVDLCRIMLADSGRIQEEDARWKRKRLRKARQEWKWVGPLYTEEDALAVMDQMRPIPFGQDWDLGSAGAVRFHRAGHILGAGIVELNVPLGQEERRIVFSGDLGSAGAQLLDPPETVERPDVLLMESTYGDRDREEGGDRTEELFEIVRRTVDRGGKVIIPSFAVGRTQELLIRLNDLVESGRLAGVPIYVDSPMAVAATRAFELHPESFSRASRDLRASGDEPLDFPGLELVTRVEDSIALNESREPCVIISASGMCTAGRIKHHLKHNISDPRATVVFVGYQAQGTLGRTIQNGVDPVRIFGEYRRVHAGIETLEGFSAHADRSELLGWFDGLGSPPRTTFLVHGEEANALSLAAKLEGRAAGGVRVPHRNQTFELD